MKRRDLLLVFCAAVCTSKQLHSQALAKGPRIGMLSPFSATDSAPWNEAFRSGLREHGWVEGKNISIEYRYAEGRNDRLPGLAADFVRLKVDVIVASASPDALAAQRVTKTVPIVVAGRERPCCHRAGR